jgi:hypothetical protein
MLKTLLILVVNLTLIGFFAANKQFVSNQQLLTAPATTPECDCPSFYIESQYTTVKSDDEIEFSAELSDDNIQIKKYTWTVENGRIISGQGTSKIKVLAIQTNYAESMSVSVQIPDYNKPCDCPTEDSTEVDFGEESSKSVGDVDRPSNVESLDLSKQEIVLPCTKDDVKKNEISTPIIEVSTIASDPENDVLTYNYTVNGGRIRGRGAKVVWDLSGEAPGKYTITAGVDDGCGICGRTETKTITISGCGQLSKLTECPKFEISGPDLVDSKSEAVFQLVFLNEAPRSVKYFWNISYAEVVG